MWKPTCSHDSFTYSISDQSPISGDLPHWIAKAEPILPIKRIAHNWAVNQVWNVTEQLMNGVRYFHFKVSYVANSFRIVHGQFGQRVDVILRQIKSFLNQHKKEVVLLHFNGFFDFSNHLHINLVLMINRLFRDTHYLCPQLEVQYVTLQFCWDHGYQVIIFYKNDDYQKPPWFWQEKYIVSEWPDTSAPDKLLSFLTEGLLKRQKNSSSFHVSQAILTPQVTTMLRYPLSTLRQKLAMPCNKLVWQWLKSSASLNESFISNINIVMLDFVDTPGIVDEIIRLNFV